MLSWKVAEKSDPPDVQLTDYGWEVKEHEHVIPAVSREPHAPSKRGMPAVTHLLNRRRTKATDNRVKWIPMNLRGRE